MGAIEIEIVCVPAHCVYYDKITWNWAWRIEILQEINSQNFPFIQNVLRSIQIVVLSIWINYYWCLSATNLILNRIQMNQSRTCVVLKNVEDFGIIWLRLVAFKNKIRLKLKFNISVSARSTSETCIMLECSSMHWSKRDF